MTVAPPDKRTGPEVTTPQGRPNVESPPTATDTAKLAPAGDFAAVRSRLRPAVAEAKARTSERRSRVLSYPDLAARLTRPPLSYTRPDQWNGYVPPRLLPEDACGAGCGSWRCRGEPHPARVNDSPYRATLVAICAEAAGRERTS